MRDEEPIFFNKLKTYKEREIVIFVGIKGLEQFKKAMELWKK